MNTRIVTDNRSALRAAFRQQADSFSGKAATDCMGLAQNAAPVRTGFLKNSIRAVQVGGGHWRVEVGASYGLYVEFGAHGKAGRPFLLPAFYRVSAALRAGLTTGGRR